MNSNKTMINKLKRAINSKGDRLLYSTNEFFSEEKQDTVTMHTIKRQLEPEAGERYGKKIELFSSVSTIQIVLFLRDMWYEMNGWEVPKDNEQWAEAKEKYEKKKERKQDVNNEKARKRKSKK